MTALATQPIAGVSPNRETEIEAVYPSVAGGVLGQIIGTIMGGIAAAIPITFIRLIVMVIVGSVLAPLGLLAYILNKLFGSYYVITNQSVQKRSMIGGAMTSQVSLGDIDEIEITSSSGYKFHRTGDLNLLNAQGALLATVAAIPYPERLKHIIMDARQARRLSDASFAQIQSRG